MKILSASQIKTVDELTISRENIKSIDLMERAAMACVRKLTRLISDEQKIYVFCGKGNNGGDGLAIARLLLNRDCDVTAFVTHHKENFSNDAQINYDLLKQKFPSKVVEIQKIEDLNSFDTDVNAQVIEAIFGSGVNKPVADLAGDVIQFINSKFKKIISIDVPAGLYIDSSSRGNKNIIRSSVALCFQLPKLALLLPENGEFVPEFELVDIDLDEKAINEQASNNYYITKEAITPFLKKRNKYDHKGTYGHALLLAGSRGKAGAAVMSAFACLRSGAGLLTVHSTHEVLNAILQRLPEAMSNEDDSQDHISGVEKPENYDAIGFGPGVGLHEETQTTLKKILQYYTGQLIIDADGLNILSENKTWLNFLPADTILTPHIKEFERLAGKSDDDFERLEKLRHFSTRCNCIVILKGAHSAIAMPDGNVFFNSSGNPGLAKGGSGDALTGIILGLLCRGYNPPQAALIGTFIHGYAADLSLKKASMESILITDVINHLPKAFKKLEESV